MPDPDAKAQIRTALDRWQTAMSKAQAKDLKALWDDTYDTPVSVVEEFEEPLIGWEAVSQRGKYRKHSHGMTSLTDPIKAPQIILVRPSTCNLDGR